MSWNSNFESQIEFIAPTAAAICDLKTNVRTRCDLEHLFYLNGIGVHDAQTFQSKHFKPGLFVHRLGDVNIDQEFVFSAGIESFNVPGLNDSMNLLAGIDIYGFLHMKVTNLGYTSVAAYPTAASSNVFSGGDSTVWVSAPSILGLGSYTGYPDTGGGMIYPDNHGIVGPYDEIFGTQRFHFGSIAGGESEQILYVRVLASGREVDSGFCPQCYVGMVIRGIQVINPSYMGFDAVHETRVGPWVNVAAFGWTFNNDIKDIDNSYMTVDARQGGYVGELHLTEARLELKVGTAEFQDYHASLVQMDDGTLLTSSQPQHSQNKDWFWLPLDVINSSSLGGALSTHIKLYKDNYTEVNGTISVKELILYGR